MEVNVLLEIKKSLKTILKTKSSKSKNLLINKLIIVIDKIEPTMSIVATLDEHFYGPKNENNKK